MTVQLTASQDLVLYSRYEDGSRPVRVLPDGWELLRLDGSPESKHTTVQSLLTAITGHPEGRHWSLERYFKLGDKYGAKPALVESNLFDLFGGLGQSTPLIITTPGISIPHENRNSTLRRKNLVRESKSRGVSSTTGLGIDLDRRAGEVRKLLFAGFGRRMFLSGYDPEDVLQEVYKGILVRNAGKCPWDAAKSSFGHYVHMVCGCILSNYHRKQYRTREMEQLGLPNPLGEEGDRWQDVASNVTVPALPTIDHEDTLLYEQADDLVDFMMDSPMPDSRLAARLVSLLIQGRVPRKDLAAALGVSKATMHRALAHLKTQATFWAKGHSNPSENVLAPDSIL